MKKKRKRRTCFILFVMLGVFFVLPVACAKESSENLGKNDRENSESCKQQEEDDWKEEEAELMIYYVKDHPYFGTAMGRYISSHRHVKIKLTPFESDEELMNRLATEIAAGSGPDAVLLSSSSAFDVYKAVQSGNIAELSAYFDQDESFRREDYYEAVLEGGKLFGGQYLVPFEFVIDSFIVRQSTLKEIGYREEDLNNFYDMSDMLMAAAESADENTWMHILSGGGESQPERAAILMETSAILLTEEDKRAPEDMDDFALLLELSKTLQDDYDEKPALQEKMKSDPIGMLRDNILVISYTANYLKARMYMEQMEQTLWGTECAILPWRNRQGKVQPVLRGFGFVNQNSRHPYEAYQILRYIMDYDDTWNTNLSVKKSIVSKQMESLTYYEIVAYEDPETGEEIYTPKMDDEIRAETEAVLGDMGPAILHNTGYYKIATEGLIDYCQGMDKEAVLASVQKEINRYLRE